MTTTPTYTPKEQKLIEEIKATRSEMQKHPQRSHKHTKCLTDIKNLTTTLIRSYYRDHPDFPHTHGGKFASQYTNH